MGLDMYFKKKTYVKNWDHYRPEDKTEVIVKKGGELHPTIKLDRVSYIVEDVAYWRKFNALHQWFVDNCQNGVDECQESYVDESQIEELVNEVLKPINDAYESGDVEKAIQLSQDLLPTQEGFFFGGQEYDEYYFNDVKETLEVMTGLLEEGGDFYYQSSW
jgi:hypothetical protein